VQVRELRNKQSHRDKESHLLLSPLSVKTCMILFKKNTENQLHKMARTKSEQEAVTSHNGLQPRRFHPSNHSQRSFSPTSVSQPSALVPATIGAIAVTAVDRYLIEDTSKNDRSSLNSDQLFRRFVDVAIGGYAGLKAYRHFRNSPHEQIHQTSKYVEPDDNAITSPPKRRRRGGNHRKRHLLEAVIGVLGIEKQLEANRKGYDKHHKRHALETAIGAYGLGRELLAARES
jgi:hypothetical protein